MNQSQQQKRRGAPELEPYDWRTAPFDEAEQYLIRLRQEMERGGHALQSRVRPAKYQCSSCGARIEAGKEMARHVVKDKQTGLMRNIFFCSAICFARFHQQQGSAERRDSA